MTKTEFAQWKAWTDRCGKYWTIDPIHNGVNRDLIAHIGGESGRYIMIALDGMVNLGSYVGACPHIGESIFKPAWTKKSESFERAIIRAAMAGGLDVLMPLAYRAANKSIA